MKNSTAKSLLLIIQEHVTDDSILITDYFGSKNETVNMSLQFVNPEPNLLTHTGPNKNIVKRK